VDGRRTYTTNAALEVTRQAWSPRGATNLVSSVYDGTGNQITLTNRNGKKWQFQFDAVNRPTNTITPLNRQTQITYNSRSLVETLKEPCTQMATNYYDAKGRLTNRVDGVGSTVYRLDANNNVTNIVGVPPSGGPSTNAWTFDAYDRVSTYKDADGNLIQYRYDANGNVTNLVYPGNKTVKYFYDSLNRLTNVTDWASRQTTFTYDLASRVKTISRPNGTQRFINYDAAGQTTNFIENVKT
jgi:YD repeat-containing protein